MFNVTRRQALATSGGLLATLLAPQRFASAAAAGNLNIAYNVNLPSFDPDAGPSSVNPTIQAIYRSVFDQYIGQKPNLAFEPGLLTGWGWNDDKTKVWMDVRKDVVWHDGTPVHARRRGLVASSARAIRRAATRSRSSGRASTTSRSTASASPPTCKHFDPTIFKWMAFLTGYVLPKNYYEKVGARRVREEADRHRPLHGRRLRGQRLSAAQGQSEILGRQAGFRDRGLQVRPRCDEPRRRDRERLLRRDAGSAVRGI